MYRTKKQIEERKGLTTRSCVISLQFITRKKRNKLLAVLRRYRGAVNLFIKLIWADNTLIDIGLKKETYGKCRTAFLSARYKNAALKQAIEIVTSTIASAKELGVVPSCPKFTGMCEFDAKVLNILDYESNEFDLLIKMATLDFGKNIVFPY